MDGPFAVEFHEDGRDDIQKEAEDTGENGPVEASPVRRIEAFLAHENDEQDEEHRQTATL